MATKISCDYSIISKIDAKFAVLVVENCVSTPVYYPGCLGDSEFRVRDRVVVRHVKRGRLFPAPEVPEQFKHVAQSITALGEILEGKGELAQLDHTSGFINTLNNGKIYFTLGNSLEAKDKEGNVSLKREYKEKGEVHFRAVGQVPEHNCAWRAVEVSKLPLQSRQLRPRSTVPMAPPPVICSVKNVEGIIFETDRDRVFVWAKEVGRINFPVEKAAGTIRGGIMGRTYAVGKWVVVDVELQDEVEGCQWKVEPGGKLRRCPRLPINSYEDEEFEVTGVGRIVRVWGDTGIIWSEDLGRVFFNRDTKSTNSRRPERTPQDSEVGNLVEFVAESELGVADKVLTEKDVARGNEVEFLAQPEFMKRELHWKAAKMGADISQENKAVVVPELPTVMASFVMKRGGSVVLYSDELQEHIFVSRFDYYKELSCKRFPEEMERFQNFLVQYVPALVNTQFKLRAVFAKPVDAVQVEEPLLSMESRAVVNTETVERENEATENIAIAQETDVHYNRESPASVDESSQRNSASVQEVPAPEPVIRRNRERSRSEMNPSRWRRAKKLEAGALPPPQSNPRMEHSSFLQRMEKSILSTRNAPQTNMSSPSPLTLPQRHHTARPPDIPQSGSSLALSRQGNINANEMPRPSPAPRPQFRSIDASTVPTPPPPGLSAFNRVPSNTQVEAMVERHRRDLSRPQSMSPNLTPQQASESGDSESYYDTRGSASPQIPPGPPPGPLVTTMKPRASLVHVSQPSARAVFAQPPFVQPGPVGFPAPAVGLPFPSPHPSHHLPQHNGHSINEAQNERRDTKDAETQTEATVESRFIDRVMDDEAIGPLIMTRPDIIGRIYQLKKKY